MEIKFIKYLILVKVIFLNVFKILIIQGGSNESLPSGEQTVIEDEYNYLSKKYVVKLEYRMLKTFR